MYIPHIFHIFHMFFHIFSGSIGVIGFDTSVIRLISKTLHWLKLVYIIIKQWLYQLSTDNAAQLMNNVPLVGVQTCDCCSPCVSIINTVQNLASLSVGISNFIRKCMFCVSGVLTISRCIHIYVHLHIDMIVHMYILSLTLSSPDASPSLL